MSHFLGQCFLKDKKYIYYIVDQIKKQKEQLGLKVVFEIGPGKGALTKYLVDIFDDIYLFEMDTSFRDILNGLLENKNCEVFWGDVLEQNLEEVLHKLKLKPEEVMIVGNIPYYITSPIFRKFFGDRTGISEKFRYGIFMIQKEVGDKIKFDAEKKSYLWWILNYNNKVKYSKTVPAKAFKPAPKVQSCIVEFFAEEESAKVDFELLMNFLDNISAYKRKTIGKILKMLEKKDKKGELNFDLGTVSLNEEIKLKRLENLGWNDMEEIFKNNS